MENINASKLKAQIMLITLLVLMVIAVVLVGVVIILNRDVFQVTTNEKYEQIYNAVESDINNIIQKYGDYAVDINTLPVDFINCNLDSIIYDIQYTCAFSDDDFTSLQIDRDVIIKDTRDIEDIVLKVDNGYTVNLEGYTNTIDVTWDGNVALEFTYVYAQGGELKSIKDIFDQYDVYTSLQGDNPFLPSANHQLKFATLDPSNTNNSTRINIGNIVAGVVTPKYITITPRSIDEEFTNLTVMAVDPSTFPFQLRRFNATGYDSIDSTTPVVEVETYVPLFPQVSSVFDYAFLTDSQISF